MSEVSTPELQNLSEIVRSKWTVLASSFVSFAAPAAKLTKSKYLICKPSSPLLHRFSPAQIESDRGGQAIVG